MKQPESEKLGFYIDDHNRSIAYPFKEIKEEHREKIKELQKKGYTLQRATFEPWEE